MSTAPVGPPQVGTPDINSLWRLDIDQSQSFAGDWAQMRGIKSFEPTFDQGIKDASDYDSVGWSQDAVTSRKWGAKVTVQRKRYNGGTVYDAAQQKCLEIANSDDPNELVHIRMYQRHDGGEAYEGYALIKWGSKGGAGDDLAEADIEFLGQGERFVIDNPFTAGAVAPTVTSLSPTTGKPAGGNQVTINGAGFATVTQVKFGATAATSFTVLSSGQVLATAPAGSGAVDVTVTSPAGTSAAGVKYTYA